MNKMSFSMLFFKISMSFLKAFFKDIDSFTFFTKLLVGDTLNKITFFHVFLMVLMSFLKGVLQNIIYLLLKKVISQQE